MKYSLRISNFLKRSLVFPILLFSSISLHWLLKKAFLSLLAILWNSAFSCLYLSFSPWLLPLFFSQLFDRMWSTGEGNGKPLQYYCLENPMNSGKRLNDRIPKEELPRSLGAQYATGDQWRNNSRKNEGTEPMQNQYPVVDVTGDRSKIRCCKEQYCIGLWNVRSMH